MAVAPRDENQRTVAMGSFNGVSIPLKIEHATGYLKIAPLDLTLTAPTVSSSIAGHDANGVSTALGVFSGSLVTLKVMNANGYLRAVNS